MGKVVVDITTSLDGFVAGPNDGPELPLGEGGERLHQWVYDLASWREPHGLAGGKANQDSELLEEALGSAGAVVVGRRMFDNAQGWGDNPPFHVPVFVVTHETRETEAKEGGTTFTFVTDGVERSVEQAKAAAGDKAVHVVGDVEVTRQLLRAGLVDELRVDVMPVLLGSGLRLFEDGGPENVRLTKIGVQEHGARTSLTFRIQR